MATYHIDLETRSRADLKKVGAHRYARDASTAILCIAIAKDDHEPRLWVPSEFRHLVDHDLIAEELLFEISFDKEAVVYSHNASFEISVLDALMEKTTGFNPPAHHQWRCTAAMGRRAALPASLEKLAETLNLTNLKDSKGKGLIRKFSVPQKTRKSRLTGTSSIDPIYGFSVPDVQYDPAVIGGFIEPSDEPEAFKEFCDYCIQDVRVEQEIHKTLKDFELTGFPLQTFLLDIDINCRGFPVNLDALRKAEKLVNEETETLEREFLALTGLKPSQGAKLLVWLKERGFKHDNLQAATLDEFFEEFDGTAEGSPELNAVLEIKKHISFASLKKIPTMIHCAGPQDNRVRGTHTYHGAGTGRWSASLVQPQNFKKPAPYMESLSPQAYKDIQEGCNVDWLRLNYGPPLEVIASCIRHFIQDGKPMLSADYSAIEARLLAWQANEEWKLDVFKGHGKIYEAAACQMFGVTMQDFDDYKKEHGKHHPLRQKSKAGELACIAEGQLVTTDHGLVPIEKVAPYMLVFDGKEFVKHGGVVYQGIKEVITYEGLTATKDHIVFTMRGQSEFDSAARSGQYLVKPRSSWESVWLRRDNFSRKKIYKTGLAERICSRSLHKLRSRILGSAWEPTTRRKQGLFQMQPTSTSTAVVEQTCDGYGAEVQQRERQGVPQLRRERDQVQVQVSDGGMPLGDEQHRPSQKHGVGSNRQQRTLSSWEPSIPNSRSTAEEQKGLQNNVRDGRLGFEQKSLPSDDYSTDVSMGLEQNKDYSFSEKGCERKTQKLDKHLSEAKTARVYDILNCGPRNRFVVSGVLVHNCGYAGGTGALVRMGALKQGLTKKELPGIIKAWREANPAIVRMWGDIERASKGAIKTPGKVFPFGKGCAFFSTPTAGMKYLFMRLPSGRKIAYPKPEIIPQLRWTEVTFVTDEDGELVEEGVMKKLFNPSDVQIARLHEQELQGRVRKEAKKPYIKGVRLGEAITIFSQLPKTVHWGRVEIHPGIFCNNQIQGIAGDFMATGLLNAEANGYPTLMIIHDEDLAEYNPSEYRSPNHFVQCLTKLPPWAEGMPLAAEGGVVEFYQK